MKDEWFEKRATEEEGHDVSAGGALGAPPEPEFTENEIKDVLTALYQDGHVDLVLADRVAALLNRPAGGASEDATLQSSQSTGAFPAVPRLEAGERLARAIQELPRYAFDQQASIYGPVDPGEGTFVRHEDIEELLAALRAERAL